MTKAPRYALVAAGGAARSILADLPVLRTQLGPVVSSSVNGAGRIVNALKSGTAVRDVSHVNACEIILACAPDTGFDRVLALLDDSAIQWHGKVLLFCDSGASSLDFPQFQRAGALAGSMNSVDGIRRTFVVEGSPEALREAKRLVKNLRGKALEVDAEGVELFGAARTLSSSLFTPLMDSCVECINQAGLGRKDAAHIAESMLLHALRSYMHAGRRGWSGPVAASDRSAVTRQYQAMRKINLLRAEYFQHSADFAFALYKTFPELARYLPKD